MNTTETTSSNIFNSPLEIGLRCLYILNQVPGEALDLQRLIYYDYLMIHSSDVPGGPISLHPKIPHRSTEILIKRNILMKGLFLMKSKELIEVIFGQDGISYQTSRLTSTFLEYLNSDYSKSLKDTSKWVISTFTKYSDHALAEFITTNLHSWGGEFLNESLLRTKDGY